MGRSAAAAVYDPVALGYQNDFAEGAGLDDLLVGAGGFSERQFLSGDGLQRAAFDAGDEPSVNLRFLAQ